MAGAVFCFAMVVAYLLGRHTERDVIAEKCRSTGTYSFCLGKYLYTCTKQAWPGEDE